MRRLAIAAGIACLLASVPIQQAAAHGGGLDRHGCHHETATGGYHCHRGGDNDSDDPDWETAGAILGGLVVVAVLIYWLKPGAQAALVSDDPSAPASLQIKLHHGDAADAGRLDYLGLNYTLRF